MFAARWSIVASPRPPAAVTAATAPASITVAADGPAGKLPVVTSSSSDPQSIAGGSCRQYETRRLGLGELENRDSSSDLNVDARGRPAQSVTTAKGWFKKGRKGS